MKIQTPRRNQYDTLLSRKEHPVNPAGQRETPPAYGFDFADAPVQQTAKPIQYSSPQVTSMTASNSMGLPADLKAGVEALSGLSMDDVKVHYNSSSPARVQAHAFARGTDIHLGPGQEKHLSHETWHVVQQKEGRVRTTLKLEGGIAVNDEQGLEKEADLMGQRSLQVGNHLSQATARQKVQAGNPAHHKIAQRQSIPAEQNVAGIIRGIPDIGFGVIQREKFIGDSARHHMHIDIAQPHYKNGNDKVSRINIGPDGAYRKEALEEVIDSVKGRLGEPGAQACYDWCLAEARAIKEANKKA